MAMPAIRRRWTREDVQNLDADFRAWPRYELIDGELIVTPSPGRQHQFAVGEIYLLLAPYIKEQGLGGTLMSPSDVELQEDTVTQPDVYVEPTGPEAEAKGLASPGAAALLLAVEVISPSSARTDRVTKREFYMESGVAEYWIVDVDARVVERWTPDRETPRVERATLTWLPYASSPALVIDLPALFDRIRQQSSWARKSLSSRA
jgi:Uma2 family endonuclease